MRHADESDFAEINQMVNDLGYHIFQSRNVYPVGHVIDRWTRRGAKVLVEQRATIIGVGTIDDIRHLSKITGRPHVQWANIYRIIFD